MQRFDLGDVGTESRSGGRGGSIGARARMGSVSPKVLIGGVVALIGVGALAWSIKSLQRPDRRPRIVMERPADAAGGGTSTGMPSGVGAEGNRVTIGGLRGAGGEGGAPAGLRFGGMPSHMQPLPAAERYTFERSRDASQARAHAEALGDGVSSAVANDEGFARMALTQRERLVEAVRLAVTPLLAGSAAEMAASVAALRGRDEGDPSESARLHERLSPTLSESSMDLGALRVMEIETSGTSPIPRRGGISMMSIRTAGDGEESRLSIVSYGTDAMFPDASEFMGSKKRAVEVRVPLRTKGSSEKQGDMDLSLVMVWHARDQVWQPADYRMFVRNGDVGRRFLPRNVGGEGK
ncbi:MAG: hypothetical protein KF705_16525 [Phycisphaeraceae bacterium]|nr:hypothetical protein [Phycisphaeraceae bacterium]